MTLQHFIQFGGVCQLSLLIAGALAAKVLDWRHELLRLCQLSRHLVWTHAGFIVMTLVAFGVISLFDAAELASGGRTARWFCGFIAVFWGVRLLVQFFVFDARPHLSSRFLTVGYHALTGVFIYLTAVYAWAAGRTDLKGTRLEQPTDYSRGRDRIHRPGLVRRPRARRARGRGSHSFGWRQTRASDICSMGR